MGRFGRGGGSNTHIKKGRHRGGKRDDAPFNWKNEEEKAALRKLQDDLDEKFGYARVKEGNDRLGWLLNAHPATLVDAETGGEFSAVDLFFLQHDGSTFKVSIPYQPYLYVAVKHDAQMMETETYLRRLYEKIVDTDRVEKEDLDLNNHLTGLKQHLLRLKFHTVQDLLQIRRELLPIVEKNKLRAKTVNVYGHMNDRVDDLMSGLCDLREFDVPYYMRYLIDEDIRVSLWYELSFDAGNVRLKHRTDLLLAPEQRVFAFDIETTKMPLKFPDASHDQIMMISYMIDKQGYLITNRQIVAEDIDDFEYTPKPEYEGQFIVFNESDEAALLRRFFEHIQDTRPNIYVHFNGDYFDWPFIEDRSKANGLDMYKEIGIKRDDREEAYVCRFAPNMDAYAWVKRDSYLPVGSQGLKAVTKAKLGYDPLELDPEDMTPFASTHPQELASYSVSDAVCTYYLYMKYVHPFIFSLCSIIPMRPDQVLRKGSGTLCEALLMVEAYKVNIIFPNKQRQQHNLLYKGHLLDTETYVGGHVEACESGVFRSNIKEKWRLKPEAFQKLLDNLDETLEFGIVVENKMKVENVTNYDEVRDEIKAALEDLRDTPMREENPSIYHLDVAAMYPNIILSNRLQPTAIVNEAACASCDFNKPGKTCQRPMKWVWRGQYLPNSRAEFEQIKNQLNEEKHEKNGKMVRFSELKEEDRAEMIKKRLTAYCKKVYKKTNVTTSEEREATVCQRENSFYVDTVRAFRDRRYEYKGLLKQWKGKLGAAHESGTTAEVDEAAKLVVLYDSLQLAHKCILNSFYGYVMRRGARWFSMEMAGIVTDTGAKIIKGATQLIYGIGRPLELDTDGVWCILPKSFPENFVFKTDQPGKKSKITVNYPCVVLNKMVADDFTNPQYADLVDPNTFEYKVHSECSIEFEVDGPYLAMILPASTEADRKLKKRYAVFEFDGTLAELKGFEIKRRGELQLIKIFQGQVFETFLRGETLEECYAEVAKVADKWLDVLVTKGVDLVDSELFGLISESRSMSKTLAEYEGQKSTSITTAKRLAEFLGDGMVKDSGLSCTYIISKKPYGAPVTERAIPVAIFQAEPAVMKAYMRKWCKDQTMTDFGIRDILDWGYYIVRLGATIQKIVTIPAALQKVENPVPRVAHPEWLLKRLRDTNDSFQQQTITSMFGPPKQGPSSASPNLIIGDIEGLARSGIARVPVVTKRKRITADADVDDIERELNKKQAVSMEAEASDSFKDFDAWLGAKKKQWRLLRARKKRKREGHESEAPARNLQGVDKYIAQQKTNIRSTHWQIIQIAPSGTPGTFTVWAIIGSQMYPIKITVPRTFYVNSRVEDKDCVSGRRVARTLPRSRPQQFLYEYTMAEPTYLEKQQELTSFFSHPDVEGVYANKTSLLFRAIVSLGCVCTVKKSSRKKSMADGYMLDDLDFKTTAEFPYLVDMTVRKVFLYHSGTGVGNDARGVFALFDLANHEATVLLHNLPASLDIPNLDRMYSEITDKAPVTFTAKRVQTAAAAWKEIERHMGRLSNAPTLVLAMTRDNQTVLRQSLPVSQEYPVVTVPFNAGDNNYPPLGWETHATKRLLQQFFHMDEWWTEFANWSRYAHIPIGNFEADHPLLISDVFVTRRLAQSSFLTWASHSSKPDLGGSEKDDYKHFEVSSPEIINPGAHNTICVEFAIESLAVNTVLESAHINELEGAGDGFEVLHTMDKHVTGRVKAATRLSVDETLATMPALKIIKTLIHDWGRDIGLTQNPYADILQGHFQRWLMSPASKLFDPALNRLVHQMMSKVFLQLVAGFRELGAHIIYADFTKVIIATKKYSMENAAAYVDYLARRLMSRDLFQFIDITPVNFWESFFFLDTANFGGISINLEGEVTEEKTNIISHWNIADYLPNTAKEAFIFVVSEFIYKVHQFKNMKMSQDEHASGAGELEKNPAILDEFALDLVATHCTRSLIPVIEELFKSQHLMELPVVVGSHLDSTNPTLELIKYICVVLSLNPQLEVEVTSLKKGLLAVIGVRAFDPAGEFVNPCRTYVLHNVICEYCNSARNLDLCRDQRLMSGEWGCATCQHPYNKSVIESTLVRIVHQLVLSYQMQDLKCVKCKMVKETNISMFCDCSGRFVCMHSKDELLQSLQTFYHISTFYEFAWLQEEVEFLSEMVPA